MENDLQKEDFVIQIKDKLHKDGIKLWLPPYFDESKGNSEEDINRLSNDISECLDIPLEACKQILGELQGTSLENLKQRNRYNESGLATLKIKVLNAGNSPKRFSKEVMLSARGVDLKETIFKETAVPVDRLKLISSGRVLNDLENLRNQNVKNGQQILAISLCETPNEVATNENQIKELENVKTDSRLLALDDKYMQLEDQFGNAIKIPKHEKKALIVAMALHEKGRASLKRNDYSRALVFLLEADEEFRRCNSQLLNTVDNYALLDLDIAWCYLCLQSFSHLPEAQERLKRCEEKFQVTYGNNMERLIAVKGTSGNESALLMRLHLLQAVVFYHQNKRDEALAVLKQAEDELKNLKVDDNSVIALVQLGYTPAEARLGLRATSGDLNFAANYINDQRHKRAEMRKKAKAEAILENERKKLGKCIDGKQYVDPNLVKILVNMGYNKGAACVALKQCNNIISDSVQYIQENPLAGPSNTKSQEFMSYIEELVPELVSAGFDPRMAKIALQKHAGDVIKAGEELLENEGIVKGDLSEYNISMGSVEDIKKKQEQLQKEEEKEEAFRRLAEDIAIADDDHLDLNLDQEEVFLNQYLSLLEK